MPSTDGMAFGMFDQNSKVELKNRVAILSYHRRNPIHMDHRPQSIDPPQQSTLAMSLAIFDY